MVTRLVYLISGRLSAASLSPCTQRPPSHPNLSGVPGCAALRTPVRRRKLRKSRAHCGMRPELDVRLRLRIRERQRLFGCSRQSADAASRLSVQRRRPGTANLKGHSRKRGQVETAVGDGQLASMLPITDCTTGVLRAAQIFATWLQTTSILAVSDAIAVPSPEARKLSKFPFLLYSMVLQRRLRILTTPARVARSIHEVYSNANADGVLAMLMHKIGRAADAEGPQEARMLLQDWLILFCSRYNAHAAQQKQSKGLDDAAQVYNARFPQLHLCLWLATGG